MADRSVSVSLELKTAGYVAGTKIAERATVSMANRLERAARQHQVALRSLEAGAVKVGSVLDRTNERMGTLVSSAAMLAPAIAPVGAVAVPAVVALSAQLAIAAGAAGVATLAFKGIGDASKALNDYQLQPTKENLAALQDAMLKIGPAGADFVRFIDSLGPRLSTLQDAARGGLLPGLEDGIAALMRRLPEVRSLVSQIAGAMGDLATQGGKSLAGPEWQAFFDYLQRTARPLLMDLGQTIGGFVKGMANLMVAFEPLTMQFSDGFLQMAQSFEAWASGLSSSASFQEFLDYAQSSLPKVADFLGSVAAAMASIVEAAAPVGAVVLPALTSLVDALGAIADSNVGPALIGAAAGVAALSKAWGLLAATGIRPGEGGQYGPLGRALGVDKAAAILPAMRQVTAATNDLRAAQQQQVAAAQTARTTMGSLAPDKTKQAAMASYVSATREAGAASERLAAAEKQRSAAFRSGAAQFGRSAAMVGGLAVATTGLADGMGLSNSASLALMGTLAGPWGAAIGGATGLVMDFGSALENAEASTEAAFRALDTGNVQQMRAQLQLLLAEWDKLATDNGLSANMQRIGLAISSMFGESEIASKASAIEQLQEALSRIGQTPDIRGLLGQTVAKSLGLTGNAFDSAAASASEFRQELVKVSAALDGRSDMRDYEAAIDDYRQTLRKAIKDQKEFLNPGKSDFNIDKSIGRDLQAQLDGFANTSLKVAEGLKGLGRVRFLDGARDQFIQMARAADIPREAAVRLADRFGLLDQIRAKPKVLPEGIPETKQNLDDVDKRFRAIDKLAGGPKVNAETGQAMSAIRGVVAALSNVRDKTITVTTIQRTQRPLGQFGGGAGGNDPSLARGGPVYGPGTKTSDSVPAWLSTGEYVMRAAAVDRYGLGLMDRINAGRFAGGGPVGATYASTLDDRVATYLRDNARQGKEQNKSLKQQITLLKKQLDKADQLNQQVQQNFRTDPFSENSTLQGVLSSLGSDTARAGAFTAAAKNAKRLGLDGAVYQALLASGNTAVLQGLDSTADVNALEKAWRQRQRATRDLTFGATTSGRYAGQSIAQLEHTLDQLQRRLKGLGKDVKDGARDGTREGTRGRDQQRRRAVRMAVRR